MNPPAPFATQERLADGHIDIAFRAAAETTQEGGPERALHGLRHAARQRPHLSLPCRLAEGEPVPMIFVKV